MDVTRLTLNWVGWPNGEKIACQSKRKSSQVIASLRKCTQALAKRSRKYTQVFNLRLLATPFVEGFMNNELLYRFLANLLAHNKKMTEKSIDIEHTFLLYLSEHCGDFIKQIKKNLSYSH